MNAAPSGRRTPCTIADARARLVDAEAFLDAAELVTDTDVVATNAVHAAIAEIERAFEIQRIMLPGPD